MDNRKQVNIGPYIIGDSHPVRIIAEIGVNHLGSLERAKEMIQAAHENGADLIKLQTYEADKRYEKSNPKYEEFTKNVTDWQLSKEEERELWGYGAALGAIIFTSTFDENSVDFAEELGTVAYKLAAFEVVNHQLVRKIASKGKPVILSRGMATEQEIKDCLTILDDHDIPYIILHTISSYPLEREHSHLRMIHKLREQFDCPIGHSDHTPGVDIPPLAVAAGANIIEKHFTTTPKRRESDNFFSVTPWELKAMTVAVKQAYDILGANSTIDKIETEEYMWHFRRHTK